MKYNFLNLFKFSAALACAAVLSFGSTAANADLWTGEGDGSSWEDPDNWLLDAVPLNNDSGNTFINTGDVVFDADTWAALQAAGNVQSPTQYRVVRLLMNESTSGPIGTGSITFDHGAGNQVLQTNGNSAIFGSRTGETTVNVLSGSVNTGSNTTFGARDGIGILNLSDGEFIVGRGNLILGNGVAATGTGIINITGGALLTRGGLEIRPGSSFNVLGSGAAQIGVGSQGTVDGFWMQLSGSTLSVGFDANGVTPILVDDVEGDDVVGGAATFEAGSILDPSDLGGFLGNVWVTVLTAEGGITGTPTLSATSVDAGWEMRIVGNDLQVQLPSNPGGGGTLKGDVDLSGEVNLFDISPFIGILTNPGAFQVEADVDCSGEVNLFDIAPFIAELTGS